jgi:hypothetical protein
MQRKIYAQELRAFVSNSNLYFTFARAHKHAERPTTVGIVCRFFHDVDLQDAGGRDRDATVKAEVLIVHQHAHRIQQLHVV